MITDQTRVRKREVEGVRDRGKERERKVERGREIETGRRRRNDNYGAESLEI